MGLEGRGKKSLDVGGGTPIIMHVGDCLCRNRVIGRFHAELTDEVERGRTMIDSGGETGDCAAVGGHGEQRGQDGG